MQQFSRNLEKLCIHILQQQHFSHAFHPTKNAIFCIKLDLVRHLYRYMYTFSMNFIVYIFFLFNLYHKPGEIEIAL